MSISDLLAHPRARRGLRILVLMWALAAIGPFFVPEATDFVARPHLPPSWEHWFGTTGQGQDVLAQTLVGARSTMVLGFGAGLAVTVLGAIVGGLSGYALGRTDAVLSFVTHVFLLLPALPFAVVLAAVLPTSLVTIAVVIVLTGWPWNARLIRAQTMSMRERDFVVASMLMGESHGRIVVFELLPNMIPLVVSCFINATIFAIGAAIGLEFIGVGDIGAVTWGTNLYWASNDAALLTGAWWTFVPTGLGIALLGFGLVMINFAVDELANPRLADEVRHRREVGPHPPDATPVMR